ncbi:hypothetical protein [Hydrogenimonas sp. SS33]|uniref:hypothetical protein n=1 Tax=Hydrogenimonas leucolamina TaxID=2954236 RepID=UPI00336BFE5B
MEILKKARSVVILSLLMITPFFGAENTQKSGVENIFEQFAHQLLEETAEEKLGELTGKNAGEIEEVELLERRGNRIVLDVKYHRVKHHRDVYIKAEVLYGGEVLPGFRSSLGQVRHKSGHVRLTISQPEQKEEGTENEWGLKEETETKTIFSDQIRLYMYHESDPDQRFGFLLFDLPKVWNGEDAPDTPQEQAVEEKNQAESTEEEVTLEEGKGESNTSGHRLNPLPKPVYIPAGTILKPRLPVKQTVKPKNDSVKPLPKEQKIVPHPMK